MFKNFLKIALRNLGRKKFHSFINLFGLTIGLAASVMIVSYVFYELSYDKHNKNYNRIYRIFTTIHSPDGSTTEAPITTFAFPKEVNEKIPEVSEIVRMSNDQAQIEYNSVLFTNLEMVWSDSSYFKIFTHQFIKGSASTCLSDKKSLVLTQSTESKIFGDKSGFGEMLRVNGDLYKITGIIEDIPENSHFDFNAIAPIYNQFGSLSEHQERGDFSYISYILTNGSENYELLQTKVDQLFQDGNAEELAEYGVVVNQSLQKLGDIHLRSKTAYEIKPPGDINNIYIFSILALFIIIIAIINFINLTTANSETRAREIGLRKVMGAYRRNLFKQFIAESMLITLIAFILALGITELFIEYFRELMNSPIILLYKTNFAFLSGLILSVILIGFFAGSYPAIQLSKYLPVEVLKGSKSSSGKKSVFLQQSLVVFQFTIATFLLISLNLVYKQISFMKNKDLGFDTDQVLVMNSLSDKLAYSFKSIKSELKQLPEIEHVTASRSVPGFSRSMSVCYKEGDAPENNVMINRNDVSYDYLKTYGINLIKGRSFDIKMGTDTGKVVLNQTAVEALGLTDPLNKKIIFGQSSFEVIGIIEDFHFKSLHEEIAPLALSYREFRISRISIKLNSKNLKETIARIENTVERFDPNYTFSYTFIDQSFTEMYEAEDRINKLITYASVLAQIISILGLIALTMQTIQKKTHEIGIRKVMGAEILQVVRMFVLDITKWVIVATFIAIPIAYMFNSRWLENFVYHTNLGAGIFIAGCLVSVTIAILTVGTISYNSARANPVESLRHE